MKKSIVSLGKVLDKTTQKDINGGRFPAPEEDPNCSGDLVAC